MNMRRATIGWLTWGSLWFSLPASAQPWAVSTDGQRVAAQVRGIDERGNLVFETAAGPRSWKAGELVGWGTFRDADRMSSVVLEGGSQIVGDIVRLTDEEVTLYTPSFSLLTAPRSAVRGIVWRPPSDPLARDKLIAQLGDGDRSRDQTWTASGDVLVGRLISSNVPPDAPLLGGLADIAIRSAGDGQTVIASLVNLTATGFSSDDQRPERDDRDTPITVLGLRDGTQFWTTKISPAGPRIELGLRDGFAVAVDAASLWEQVIGVQVMHAGFDYLSDFSVLGYKHIPFLDANWEYGINRNVLGGSLRTEEGKYLKGIGMHSTSRLAYELARPYRWFEAELALDQAAGQLGSVVYRVFVERGNVDPGAGSWQVVYESPVIRGGDSPLPIRVEIAQAARLALVVDFADRGDELDYANWLNARLVP